MSTIVWVALSAIVLLTLTIHTVDGFGLMAQSFWVRPYPKSGRVKVPKKHVEKFCTLPGIYCNMLMMKKTQRHFNQLNAKMSDPSAANLVQFQRSNPIRTGVKGDNEIEIYEQKLYKRI